MIFHSYVKLPEGKSHWTSVFLRSFPQRHFSVCRLPSLAPPHCDWRHGTNDWASVHLAPAGMSCWNGGILSGESWGYPQLSIFKRILHENIQLYRGSPINWKPSNLWIWWLCLQEMREMCLNVILSLMEIMVSHCGVNNPTGYRKEMEGVSSWPFIITKVYGDL